MITVEGGKAVEKVVMTGRRGADWVEIKSGVNVGQASGRESGELAVGAGGDRAKHFRF